MKKNKGFTLLEILIAVFIFAIVSMIMTSALHHILFTQKALENKSIQFEQLQLTSVVFSNDIEQIIDRPILDAHRTEIKSVIGMKNALFLTHAGWDNPLGNALG